MKYFLFKSIKRLSTKRTTVFIGVFIIIFIVIHFLQPGNYLKSTPKNRMVLSFSISLFYTFSFLLQYFFFQSKSRLKPLKFYLNNVFFLLLNSFIALLIVYILHPFLYGYTYLKTFFTILSFSILLQIIFVLMLNIFHIGNKTISAEEKPYIFIDNNRTIAIPQMDLYFIKSSGNYIEIVEKNNFKGHILRSSLKEIEQKYPQLYRCHKSYLVNLDNIKSISGNSKGYELTFYNNNIEKIPVARDKGEFIKGRLT